MKTPPPDVILPPLRPCMGGNPQQGHNLRLTPVCSPVCCYWFLLSKTLIQFQACDLRHASFLRPCSAITSSAFCFPWFKLLLTWLHFSSAHSGICSLGWANVLCHHARASGRQNDVRWGVFIEYHHLVVQGCILGWWLCLCALFVVVF